jgi:hypothetical protein
VREMEDCWPSGVGLRGQALNRPVAALAEDRRGERTGKRRGLTASGGDQEDAPEHSAGRSVRLGVVVEASKGFRWHRNRGFSLPRGMSLAGARVPGQAVPGVEAA